MNAKKGESGKSQKLMVVVPVYRPQSHARLCVCICKVRVRVVLERCLGDMVLVAWPEADTRVHTRLVGHGT